MHENERQKSHCLANLGIKLCDFKMDLTKWQLNGVECNFGLKSCLWFQIELALRVCRFWFQTKLHSTQFNYHNLSRSIITLCPLLRCLLEIIPWWVRSLVLAHLTESIVLQLHSSFVQLLTYLLLFIIIFSLTGCIHLMNMLRRILLTRDPWVGLLLRPTPPTRSTKSTNGTRDLRSCVNELNKQNLCNTLHPFVLYGSFSRLEYITFGNNFP